MATPHPSLCSLQEAFHRWADADNLKAMDELSDYSTPRLVIRGHPEYEHYAAMHRKWREYRNKLINDLVAKLRAGQLVATAFTVPLDVRSQKQRVPPDLWSVLTINTDEWTAQAEGLHLVGIEVGEAEQMIAATSQQLGDIPFAIAEETVLFEHGISLQPAASKLFLALLPLLDQDRSSPLSRPRSMSARELSEKVEQLEATVRRTISRARQSLGREFHKHGIDMQSDAIFKSEHWNGYRLGQHLRKVTVANLKTS